LDVITIDEVSQHLFNDAIGPLSLTIGFGMEGRREAGLDTESVAKPFPEIGGKAGITVRDKNLRGSVILIDMSQE